MLQIAGDDTPEALGSSAPRRNARLGSGPLSLPGKAHCREGPSSIVCGVRFRAPGGNAALSNFELSIALFLQFAIILAACRLVGCLVRPFGQPQVVAEMITGVLLGPSLFGLVAPGLQAQLFPEAEPADHLRPGPDRARALHVPDRPRVRPRAHPQADEERGLRLLGGHRDAVRPRRSARLGPDGPLPALRPRRRGSGRRRCSWARRCRSPPSRCWRGSSPSAASPAPRSGRSRSPPARSTTRRPGACWRWCWRASPARSSIALLALFGGGALRPRSCSPSAASSWRSSSPGSWRCRRGEPPDPAGRPHPPHARRLAHRPARHLRRVRRLHPRRRDAARGAAEAPRGPDRAAHRGLPAADVLHQLGAQHRRSRCIASPAMLGVAALRAGGGDRRQGDRLRRRGALRRRDEEATPSRSAR